ncbi:hypothetical protein BV25DRAFT_1922186 [Artomyces pyxidatus]|uniref:Uncharacterized protein n=1 Tax=Artomyces pyxidatus TaxID=48021 RepID=A0ACB8SG35_9AGAM|nr:hypothetical protein BV25DRAFT_1922186 [Artomyces pyxidatus]
MAFIVSDTLVRDLWPKCLGQCDHLPPDYSYGWPWERCPANPRDLRSWAFFTHNRKSYELSWRPFIFAHLSSSPYDVFPGRVLEEVNIRIHGFVEVAKLNGTGNWNGFNSRKSNMPYAEQSLTLGCGAFPDIFKHQVEALKNIEELGHQSLSPRQARDTIGTLAKDNNIFFRRKVFRKGADPSVAATTLNRLADRASLQTKAGDIMDDNRLAFRVLGSHNVLENASHDVIEVGDFVEVHTFVRVLLDGMETGLPRVRLALHPTAVIRLCPREAVSKATRKVETCEE